jgi:hypothetical protein
MNINPNITLPLQTLVHHILRGEHYVPISSDVAEIILHHTNNKHTCHVQFPSDEDVDILGNFIETPMLWEYGAWCRSSEKWLKMRVRSQKERDERFILEANITQVARCILRQAYVTPDAARMIARSMITKKDYARIKLVGCKKLFTTIEELP